MTREMVGRYTLERPLASGGMADIYVARDGEQSIALKRILPALARQPQYIAMFVDEGRLLARLHHPNIVRVLEVGEGSAPFLAMELLHGVTLSELARTPLSLAEVLAIGIDAATGLHYAHTQAIIHRDVTPRNLFVTTEGTLKLLDFGIARAEDREAKTRTGTTKGTLRYMSPEQCRARPVDARSDIFSLSVVLWEVLAHRSLFERDNDLDTMLAVTETDAPLLTDVPRALSSIIARGLARPLDGRFASIDHLGAALQQFASSHALDLDAARRLLATRAADAALLAQQPAPLPGDRTVFDAPASGYRVDDRAGHSGPITKPLSDAPRVDPAVGVAAIGVIPPIAVPSSNELDPAVQLAPKRRWLAPAIASLLVAVIAIVVVSLRGGETPASSDRAPAAAPLTKTDDAMPTKADDATPTKTDHATASNTGDAAQITTKPVAKTKTKPTRVKKAPSKAKTGPKTPRWDPSSPLPPP